MKDKEESLQASAGSRWHRLGWWIWLRIILLTLVAGLLAGYAIENFRCSRFIPTGDALYDHYAKAVLARQSLRLFHSGDHQPTYLPDSLFAEWEDEFGGDPRYWQLRCFCASNKGEASWKTGKKVKLGSWNKLGETRGWDRYPSDTESYAGLHLQAGYENGAYDWKTLELYRRGIEGISERDSSEELKELNFAKLDAQERRQAIGEILRKYEQLELDLHNDMVEVDPSQAWPYYTRAMYWFKYGESELALADLKAGNAAPNVELAKTFPVDFLLGRMENGQHLGNDVLAGAVLECDAWDSEHYWFPWRDHYKEATGMLAWGGETEMYQELHLTACRVGQAKNRTLLDITMAATFELILCNDLLQNFGEDLTFPQRKLMLQTNKRASSVHNYWKPWSAQIWQHSEDYPRLRLMEQQTNWVIANESFAMIDPPHASLPHAEVVWQYLLPSRHYKMVLWEREQKQIGLAEMKDVFVDLEHVNMSTLEWPDAWGSP